jgi:hypothetical protein
VIDPSCASADVTLTAIARENALSIDLIRSGHQRVLETRRAIGARIRATRWLENAIAPSAAPDVTQRPLPAE